jgi:hypothetical protein
MPPDNNAKSFSFWSSVGHGLLYGTFTMGLLYMVDWKQESVQPFYYYFGGVIVIAVGVGVTEGLIRRYKKRKK